jgi:nucleotide-binding universal stress UspA family protein
VQTYRSQAETKAALQALARRLPAAADVVVSVETTVEAVNEAVRRTQPLLLAMGLSTEHDALDHVLHNQALPVLRGTHRPLLLVPELAPAAQLPRRVLLALDAESFVPNAATRALVPLLAAWPASYTVSHVLGLHEQEAFPGQRVLHHLHLSRLLPPTTPVELYEAQHVSAVSGVLQAIDDTQADLLVLLARPRSFLGRLFHRSITAQVLRRSRVPVLLLPTEASDQPAWLPGMT